MDGNPVTDDQPSITLEEQLDKLCEYYMSIGVPYDVFWYGDYCSFKYFEKVYLQKRKLHNEEMWMMGMYVHHGVQIAIGNAFRGKGQQVQNYLDQPIKFFKPTPEEEKAEAEAIRKRVIENLSALKAAWDKKNVRENSGTGDTDS